MGLVNQAIQRSPRWILKKLTETYLTLSLSEIAQAMGIPNEDDVRALVLSMVSHTYLPTNLSPSAESTYRDSFGLILIRGLIDRAT